jgi:hypothetical protein
VSSRQGVEVLGRWSGVEKEVGSGGRRLSIEEGRQPPVEAGQQKGASKGVKVPPLQTEI